MKQYFTAIAPTPKALDLMVEKMINDGWALHGDQYYATGRFIQVVKKGELKRVKSKR